VEHYAADGPPPGVPAAVPTEADAAAASEVVRILLGYLGYDNVTLDVQDSLLPVQMTDDPALVINIRGSGTDRLLAHADRSLFALQFVARLILNRRSEGWTNLLLDVNGDRAQRLKEIYHMAEQSAQLVEREGRPVSLPPMSPYERRVVHLVLKDHGTIATQSIGAGPNRKVTVRRKDQLLPDM
jgi:spoIIIJ-associated protein